MFGVHFEAMVSKTQTNQRKTPFRVILNQVACLMICNLISTPLEVLIHVQEVVLATAQMHPNLARG